MRLDDKGYCVIVKNRDGTVLHGHRLEMERQLGRPLKTNEDVHHIDERRWNNCPFNLELKSKSQHMQLHRSGWVVHRGNEYTDSFLLEMIRLRQKELGRRIEKRDMTKPHYNTYKARFRSWTNARKMALGW